MPIDQAREGIQGGTAGFSADSRADVSDTPDAVGEAGPAPDPTSKASLVEQLEEVCTDWESDSHALALQLTYEVRPDQPGPKEPSLAERTVAKANVLAHSCSLLTRPAPPGTRDRLLLPTGWSSSSNGSRRSL